MQQKCTKVSKRRSERQSVRDERLRDAGGTGQLRECDRGVKQITREPIAGTDSSTGRALSFKLL